MKILRAKDTVWRDVATDTETDKNYLASADSKAPTDDIIAAGLKLCTET